jgi:hypothetical protein
MNVVAAELGYFSCAWADAGDNYSADDWPMMFSDYSCTGDEAEFKECN